MNLDPKLEERIRSKRDELQEHGELLSEAQLTQHYATFRGRFGPEQLADVLYFDRRLGELLEGRTREARLWCPWKAADEQPAGWDPDINDGVRVNIAPVQRLGLLRAPELAAKDLKSLLAPEGRGG